MSRQKRRFADCLPLIAQEWIDKSMTPFGFTQFLLNSQIPASEFTDWISSVERAGMRNFSEDHYAVSLRRRHLH